MKIYRFVAFLFMNLMVWFVVIVIFAVNGARANEIVGRSGLNFDESLSDQEADMYGPITRIAVAEIHPPERVQYGDSQEWVNGLYYYSITKLGFADIPFNYIVSWQGDTFKTKSGGNDVLPLVSWSESDELGRAVLVGYFNNNREITNAGSEAINGVVSYLMSLNDLDQEDIVAVDLFLSEKTEDVELGALIMKNSTSNSWRSFIDELRSNVNLGVVTVEKEYKGTINEVSLPEQVEGGQDFIVEVEATNDGNFPWYNYGEATLYIATSEERGRHSPLFVTDKWASFSRVVKSIEDWVLPGEIATFKFEVNTPLIPGDYSEKFELLRLPGLWMEGTQFSVEFKVEQGDYELVEILDTDTGSLNVRACAAVGCDELGQVTPGDIVINKGKDGAWYKVLWNGTDEGWIYGKYVKEI